jgi:hypothetical protein
VHQEVPIPYKANVKAIIIIFTEAKYSKQDIVWKSVDCCGLSVILAYAT